MHVATRQVGNVPADATTFVDRRAELADIRRLLSQARLVTLIGPGGVGKSRLALRVGARRGRFADGVWLVDLAPLQDPALIAHTVLDALAIQDVTGEDPVAVLSQFLRHRRLLLVWDNCEHLTQACAELATALLRAAASLRILVTSRQELHAPGEHVYHLLPLPADVEYRGGRHAAAELFAQRAAAVQPGFKITDKNRLHVMDICRRLDGIPLAIELAAARLPGMSVRQLADLLDDRFGLLIGWSTPLPQHRTLRATVDWSYELCEPMERVLWARATVFAGGFDLTAAEEICAGAGIDRSDVLHLLDRLIGKSILGFEQRSDRMRFGILDTLRRYGRDRLRATGEETRLQQAHAEHFLRLAEQAEQDWFGPEQRYWFDWLKDEHDNLRAAFHFLAARDAEAALRMAAALWFHWVFSGRLAEGRLWLQQALALPAAPTAPRARALWTDAMLAGMEGRLDIAADRATQARDLAEEVGEPLIAAQALARMGVVAMYRRDPAAETMTRQALARIAALGRSDDAYAVVTRHALAGAKLEIGDLPGAARLGAECIDICQVHGDQRLLLVTLMVLALVEWSRGRLPVAAAHAGRALSLQCVYATPVFMARIVEIRAWIAQSADQSEGAAVLLGAADRLWHGSGIGGSLRVPYFSVPHQRCVAGSRGALGDAAFEAAFQRGRTLTSEKIITFVLGTQLRG